MAWQDLSNPSYSYRLQLSPYTRRGPSLTSAFTNRQLPDRGRTTGAVLLLRLRRALKRQPPAYDPNGDEGAAVRASVLCGLVLVLPWVQRRRATA